MVEIVGLVGMASERVNGNSGKIYVKAMGATGWWAVAHLSEVARIVETKRNW